MPQPMPDTMDIALYISIRGIEFCLNWNQVVFERYSMYHGIVDGHNQSGLPTPILKLSRNPEVFKLVVDHLSDLAVFPITSSVAESAGLPLDVLVRYLIDDAIFYRLPRLEALARAEQTATGESTRDIINRQRLHQAGEDTPRPAARDGNTSSRL
jgi:hypothetical protein